MGIEVTWQASDYYSFVTMMSLLTGLTFQFPLALIILMWLELVRPRTLLKSWRGMLFGILVLVGLITPIGDPLSLCPHGNPLLLLPRGGGRGRSHRPSQTHCPRR